MAVIAVNTKKTNIISDKMKKIFFILLSGLFTGPVFGETIKINETPKVILYKLQIKTDDKKFKYYSEIIPLSLSKSIDKLKKYEIRSLPEVKDFKKIPPKSEQSKNYVNSLNIVHWTSLDI